MARKVFWEPRTGYRAEDDGQKRSKFDDAVSPRKPRFGQKLGQQSILGGTKDCRLAACKKNGHKEKRDRRCSMRMKPQKCGYGKNHYHDLENLCADGHRSFAEAIGQISASHRKQDERHGKEGRNQKNQMVFLFCIQMKGKNQVDEKIFQAVLVKRTLKLRDDQTPEA